MNRKEIGKWIAVIVFAIAMSVSFQTEITNAEIIEDESIENTIPQEETSDEETSEDEIVENISDETVVVNTDVNFYIQLDNAVMDVEGDINFRDTKYFSGSVAKSTIDPNLSTDFQYAGKGTDEDSVFQTDSNIRDTILGQPGYVSNCPNDEDVFLTLQNDHTGKTQAYFQSKDIDITNLTSENYSIYWYVVKYHNDGWHVDGILMPKSSDTDIEPTPEPEPTLEPEPEPTIDPTPITTPDPVITEIPYDDTPSALNPSDDVDDDTTTEPTDIDDEDVPLSDGTDVDNEDISVIEEIEIDDEDVPISDETELDDEDVPLADLPEEDDAEVTDILDEDTPLSDNPMTGDSDSIFWAIMAICSVIGLVILFAIHKCEKNK